MIEVLREWPIAYHQGNWNDPLLLCYSSIQSSSMLRVTWRRQAFFFFPRKVFCNPGGFLSCFFATAFYSKVRRSLGEVTSFSSTFLSFQMKLFALMSLFFVLSSNHLTYGDEKPKKLQIGVKKRVENCDQRSLRGDVLSMHYTVRIFFLEHSIWKLPKNVAL